MDFKTLISRIDGIAEDVNPARQAAKAIDMKKHHVKPKNEGNMADAENNPTGPKFGGYWKGTDPNPPKPGMGVGGEAKENLLRGFERDLKENPRRRVARDLMREYKEFVVEYGGVGGYGAASQAPQGTTATPAELQKKANDAQIQKNTNNIAPTLNGQGAAAPLDKVKFQGVMAKLDDKSNQNLQGGDLKQLQPLAVAASNIIKDKNLAPQFKALADKAMRNDQKQATQVQQAEKQIGTNAPAGQQNTQTPIGTAQNQTQPNQQVAK